ncbi:HesA/MoeB/ThiF family protein [Brachymonas sp. M4Q-1]|uniref:HesA/MoeB/ThiF family protein n=1 Tax=Brachymonas sp. M4Q-1 TaxID=3416906 RepID=UPI003CF64EF9
MSTEAFVRFLEQHPSLLPEVTGHRDKVRLFPIRLPELPDGRQFQSAWLVLPSDFPNNDSASIRLSSDAVLRVPHVEYNGNLCLEGDPGPGSGNTAEDRINALLRHFYLKFLDPWLIGELDGDFGQEALHYWTILVNRSASSKNAVTRIYTVDNRHPAPRVYLARLLLPSRIVVAGDNPALSDRFVASLGNRAAQVCNVLVADIPIAHALTPLTWPRTESALERLVAGRLGESLANKFQRQRRPRGKAIHRIVLLRAPHCSFGFLLTGGPPTVAGRSIIKRAYPTTRMLPLLVDRIDPLWTCGREQHPEIACRQRRHVLVLGAGALGSPVIDQLAKAGVGCISVVDPDTLSTANIGRHLLGAEAIGHRKADLLVKRVALSNPAVLLKPYYEFAQTWIAKRTLAEIDVVIDLTGEPDVRWCLEQARQMHPRPLLIGWMEPYVAAAHACILPTNERWMRTAGDPLESLQAVDWPKEVIQREPACSSDFQSYTSAAAAHAVALISEAALALIDGLIAQPVVRSWVRGKRFLDGHYPGLEHRAWAKDAVPYDGISLERAWHE